MAKRIAALLAKNVRATRSALYLWLYENYADIEPVIRLRRSWQAVARTAREAGITGPDDGGPSRQAVRKAWARVELDRAASATQARAPTAVPARTVTPPASEGTPHERRGNSTPGPRFAFNNEATDDDLARLTGVKPKPR